jgi:SAM-dependent methyltransferase
VNDRPPAEASRYMRSNRHLWEEWTPIHERSGFYDLPGFVNDMRQGRDRLRETEVEEVGDVAGKSVLHLMCHLGTDSLSWARRGARVTGVDFSSRSIAVARSLSETVGIEATFVEADVYSLSEVLSDRFDLVYASHGVLGWLPELDVWARLLAGFLKEGGAFYLADIHPFPLLLDRHDSEGGELRFKHRYFPSTEPLEFPVVGSYADRGAAVSVPSQFRWPHSLGELVSAVARAPLRIGFLHEFPYMVYEGLSFLERREDGLWWIPESLGVSMPLSFSLRATKTLNDSTG